MVLTSKDGEELQLYTQKVFEDAHMGGEIHYTDLWKAKRKQFN